MRRMVCFVSDFGLDDAWVGVCHAVMLRSAPGLEIVDMSHQVPPFDIRKGAAVAAAAVSQVPDAVHLVVVDPGVGGSRDDICIASRGGTLLVGPDNGVLLPAVGRAGGVDTAWVIDETALGLPEPSATFHARDVLAPAAAFLADGGRPDQIGREVEPGSLVTAPFGGAVLDGDSLVCEVVDIDRFGSVRLAVTPIDLARIGGRRSSRVEVSFGHVALLLPLATTFSDVPSDEPLVLWDSSGWLTLAIRDGSAAERYGLVPAAGVRLRFPA